MKSILKSRGKKALHSEKVRFGLVGAVNTVVDFIVLNFLVIIFSIPLLPANIASTSAALATSFILNKKAVFRDAEKKGKQQLVLFLVVSLIGIWVVQGTVLAVVHGILRSSGVPEAVALNAGKLVGICFGLVWNYVMYSKVVFPRKLQS